MKKFIYLLLIPLCVGFVACGDDDPEPSPTPTPTPTPVTKVDLTGWWMVKTADVYSYRGETKSAYRALHFINNRTVDKIDLTTERQWFYVDVTGDNEFATTIDGTNYYYLNRETYYYTQDGNSITLPTYPYSNNSFYYSDNKIINGSDTYYKVK